MGFVQDGLQGKMHSNAKRVYKLAVPIKHICLLLLPLSAVPHAINSTSIVQANSITTNSYFVSGDEPLQQKSLTSAGALKGLGVLLVSRRRPSQVRACTLLRHHIFLISLTRISLTCSLPQLASVTDISIFFVALCVIMWTLCARACC